MSDIGKAIMEELRDIKRATLIGVKDTLTIDECALLTGYSVQTLYTFTSKREIPHFKRGNYLYFSKKEVEEWLKSNPVPTVQQINQTADTYIVTRKMGGGKTVRP